MNQGELNVMDLLEYLEEVLENAPKIPITGKAMIDTKEFEEVIEQIRNYLPDELKKAKWVMGEKDRILENAQKEYQNVKKETMEMMRKNIENHDMVKEAKIRANEIIGLAKRDAKAITLGSREYSTEILSQLDNEIEEKKLQLIQSMQESFEKTAKEIEEKMTKSSETIKENINELRNM